MYAELSALISSAKTALDIAKSAKELANYNELVSAVAEVHAKLMDATVIALASQEKHSALIEERDMLKEKLVKAKNWKTQSKDYALQPVGVEKWDFAQIYKPSMQTSKERHWACAKCFQEQNIYILNFHKRESYKCPNCKTEISPIIEGGQPAPINSAYEST